VTTRNGIPVIETDRLLLRAPSADDLAASTEMWSNPEVVRHIGGKPFTREDVWGRILRGLGLWSMLGYGYWAVYDKASGRFVATSASPISIAHSSPLSRAFRKWAGCSIPGATAAAMPARR
jgi:RimJ/RimL family protein N-acetyltransferase